MKSTQGFLFCLICALAVCSLWADGEPSRSIDSSSSNGEKAIPLKTLLTIEPDTHISRASEGDIIPLTDGRLALVYSRFSGDGQDHAPAVLAIRTSSDSGRSWSTDRVLVPNEGGRNVMSVSLLEGKTTGELLLFYLRKDTPHSSCTLLLRRSSDNLETLSEPVVVTTLPGYHVVNNARVIRLKSGRLLVPAALHTDLESTSSEFTSSAALTVYYSDDDGHTWKRDQSRITPVSERTIVLQEPGLVELSDGRVMMYIRTDQGCQMVQYSSDKGETWTMPEKTSLASPVSPATIERIPGSNMLVTVWNDHSGRWPYQKGMRNPLCLAVSRDDGKSWSPSMRLEEDGNGWYCYTSMTFLDGRLILSYCAGQGRANGLNRLKVAELPVKWISSIGCPISIGSN